MHDPALTFEQITNVLPGALLLVRGDGRVVAANRAAGELFQTPQAELAGRALSELAKDPPTTIAQLLARCSRSARLLPCALTITDTTGRTIDCRCEGAAIVPRNGEQPALLLLRLESRHEAAGQFVWLSQRIDDLTREVARRKAAEQQLSEASQRKDDFLAMLAHELRNPLAPMQYGVQLLQRQPPTPEVLTRVTTMIERQIGHMARLIDDLLDVARLTRGRVALRLAPVSLVSVLDTLVQAQRPAVEARGIKLTWQRSGDVVVDADETRLSQVFGNLLGNAVKFTDPGGEIAIELHATDSDAVITIRDTGLGIDPDTLPHVFDAFIQADRSLDRSRGGLGIGLTIVRTIILLHGGLVDVASDGVGHGSVFTVRLPLRARADAAGDPTAPATDADVAAPARLRVLVVDDNADAADGLVELLRQWSHQAVAVGDGETAVAQAQAEVFDVVLLDIGLPLMDGYTLARELRQRAGSQPLLLVTVSGYGDAQTVAKSRAAGCDDHLTKPVDIDRLAALLGAHGALISRQGSTGSAVASASA